MKRHKSKTPENLKQAFELGYLAAAARLRRELPAAWRDAVLNSMTGEIADREELARRAAEDRKFATHVRGVRLVLLRCEAAASMLGWRKELPHKTREQLREAIGNLMVEARRLGAA